MRRHSHLAYGRLMLVYVKILSYRDENGNTDSALVLQLPGAPSVVTALTAVISAL